MDFRMRRDFFRSHLGRITDVLALRLHFLPFSRADFLQVLLLLLEMVKHMVESLGGSDAVVLESLHPEVFHSTPANRLDLKQQDSKN